MTTTKLATYKNGDYLIHLYSDGTKVREGEGIAEFPESIDMKITDRCDMNCPYCHESSSKDGEHAYLDNILQIIKGLPPGVEIALGGGNPLEHPSLIHNLHWLKRLGLISNLTVNAAHLDNKTILLLNFLSREKLIHGLGISISSASDTQMFLEENDDDPILESDNIVFHCILGEMNPFEIMYIRRPCKVLLLGDKRYGRGEKHFQNDERKIARWRYFLPAVLSRKDMLLSFDNLAIEQLDLQNVLPKEIWEKHYMGNDGQFTMYIDTVKMQYAKNSIGPRKDLNGKSARDVFKTLQEKK